MCSHCTSQWANPREKEQRDIREEARRALLPMAFAQQSTVLVWVDPQASMLVLDAASQAKADAVMTCLVKAVEGLAVRLVDTQTSPSAAMALWLSTKSAPPGFTVDRDCELKAADESKASVRYTRHALDTDEVCQHVAQGKMPTRLALTWSDRVSLVLTEALQFKKVEILEGVLQEADSSPGDVADDNFDGDVALMTGTLRALIAQMMEALGGERQASVFMVLRRSLLPQ